MTIIRAAEWHLGPETAQGAPEAIHVVECVECGEEQAADNNQVEVELWALRHTGRNTDHRQFRLSTEAFWRVSPAPGNPLYDVIEHAQGAARIALERRAAGDTGSGTP